MWINKETGFWYDDIEDIKHLHRDTSFPSDISDELLAGLGYFRVMAREPEYNKFTHSAHQISPANVDGAYVQRWEYDPRSSEQIIGDVVRHVQTRLDTFAKSRNYDGILSACTYATSPTQKFAAEGQYCVDVRDATWAALYTLMGQVQAGVIPMPTTVADVMSALPVLEWPE